MCVQHVQGIFVVYIVEGIARIPQDYQDRLNKGVTQHKEEVPKKLLDSPRHPSLRPKTTKILPVRTNLRGDAATATGALSGVVVLHMIESVLSPSPTQTGEF
jgi:hypothetical protein